MAKPHYHFLLYKFEEIQVPSGFEYSRLVITSSANYIKQI